MNWVLWFGWMFFRSAGRGLFGLRIEGWEHLIEEGPVLVVANHESYLDPPLLESIYHDEMYVLARKSLFTRWTNWLYRRWLAIPVDQERPDMVSLKTIVRLLRDGNRVLIFPEGSRTHDGSFGDAQPGTGLIAVKSGVPIQPLRITGARDALPRGSARVRFARITIRIGPPIRLTPEEIRDAQGKDGYLRLARRMMDAVTAL